MHANQLGRVVDPKALDISNGPRAYVCITVPSDWLSQGCELDVALKTRLVCARCQGGGCDSCHCSGALRAPDDPALRTLRLQIPQGSRSGMALRVTNPFGALTTIEQLLVEFKPGDAPSPNAHKIKPLFVESRRGKPLKSKPKLKPEPKPKRVKALSKRAKTAKKTAFVDIKLLLALAAIAAFALTSFLDC